MDSRKRRREEDDNDGEESRQLKRWIPWIFDRESMELFITMLVTMISSLTGEVLTEKLQQFQQPAPRLRNGEEPNTRYRLKFLDDIPKEIYTHRKVTTEDGKDVRIAIVDTNRIGSGQNNVISDPLFSSSVDIVVLHGDVEDTDHENWAKNGVAREREGREPLLKGEQVVKLQNGVGLLDMCFTDISKRARKQRFRIGLKHKPAGNTHPRVQSTISQQFRVLDRRGFKERPKILRLDDKVWNLDKIPEGGAFHNRLIEAGIDTVRQFLLRLAIDPEKLRVIIGGGQLTNQGFTNETWERIVESAKKCHLGNEVYSYNVGGDRGVVLLFNSGSERLQINIDGCTIDNIDGFDQALVKSWKEEAFANTSEFKLMVEALPLIIRTNVTSVQASHLIDHTGDKAAPCSTSRENLPRAEHCNYLDHHPMAETSTSGQAIQMESHFNDAAMGTHSLAQSIRNAIGSAFDEPLNSLPQPSVASVPSSSSHPFDFVPDGIFKSDQVVDEMVLAFQPYIKQVVHSNIQQIPTMPQFSSHQNTHSSSPLVVEISLSTNVGSDPSSSQQSHHIDDPSSSQQSHHIDEPENDGSPARLDQLHFGSDDDTDHVLFRCHSLPNQGRSSPTIMELLSGNGRSKLRGTVTGVVFSIRIARTIQNVN